MISEKQLEDLRSNMSSLDYDKGTNILHPNKKKMVDECFLFIGAGGTGGKALVRLKKEMQAQIEAAELKSKVRFLFVDTDGNDISRMVDTDKVLERSETLPLISNNAVKESINPQKQNWVNVENWANSQLYTSCNSSTDFSGRGAGGKRQVGRAHLAYGDNYNVYTAKISAVITDLITGQNLSNLKVKVYFFAGIAGGTGSGTIVDLAIIARDTICGDRNPSFSMFKDKVDFYGNIFMPSACGRTTNAQEEAHGNRNAYAALKEIDYFSSLEDKNEKDVMQYGSNKVVVNKNLFDFCNIVEGNSAVQQVNPAAMAQDVTIQSIINTIVRNNYQAKEGPGVFLVDSIRSNRDEILTKISSKPETQFPRNANYIYSVTGFSQCVVPTDLLCSYIMAKIYNELYNRFKQGTGFPNTVPNKKIEMFERFITEAKLDKKYIDVNGANTNLIRENIDRTVGRWMEIFGPFFLINFSKELAPYIRDNYVAPIATKTREKYKLRSYIWSMAADIMAGYNNGLFEIYVNVIEEFKKILDSNGEILTDTQMYEKHFGAKSFSWSPINIATKGKNDPMLIYLDMLLNQTGLLQNTIGAFCSQLWALKDKWGRLLDQGAMLQFDAAEDIRMFLQTHIGAIIQNSAQDFILKVYSGDPNATAANSSPQTFQNAAKNIYDEFRNRSNPMAQTDNVYESINLMKFMAIPQEWKQLYNALVAYNAQQGGYFEIYESDVDDRIVCMQFNNGVAAYMLKWTKAAEEIYEKDNGHIGLHMSQSSVGKNWISQPNLYVEGLWEIGEDKTDARKREAGIIRNIEAVMEHAKNELGIVELNGGDPDREVADIDEYPFSIYLVNGVENMDADAMRRAVNGIYQILDIAGEAKKNYSMKPGNGDSLAVFSDENKKKLVDAGLIKREDIIYGNMCMVMPDDQLSSETKKKNKWHLSKQIVRRKMSLKRAVEDSVKIYDELARMIAEHNAVIGAEELAKTRIKSFVNLYKFGHIRLDEVYNCLLVLYNAPEKVALDMSDYKNVEKECWEYFLYKDWFLKLSDDDVERMMSQTVQKEDFPDDTSWKQYRLQWQQWQESSLKPALQMRYSARQVTQYIKFPMQTAMFEKAIIGLERENVTADGIREFYSDMINNYL